MKVRWTTMLTAEVIAQRRARGEWADITLADQLDSVCRERPGQTLVIEGSFRLTATDLRLKALKLAADLTKRGLLPGDVVSFQLPNWHEAIVIELCCVYGGFVCNPIVHIYRDAEVRHIIKDAGSRVLFVPERFRGFDYKQMIERIEREWGGKTEMVLVRPEGRVNRAVFHELLDGADGEFKPTPRDPNEIKLLMYTSGTTGRAKGVLHTHNTIGAEIGNLISYLHLDHDDVILMPSPLGHITGYLYGMQLPIALGCPVVLMETWNAAQAAELIERHQVTFTLGATPFVQELARFAAENKRPLPSLRYFPTGGAPVPPEVIYLANSAFSRCTSFRLYGSTEAPTVSLGVPDRNRADLGATTEGFVVGHEIRLTDRDGNEVAHGAEGEIRTRGPEVCVGYADVSHTAEAFDNEGFFCTGDLARMTPDNCLIITGRSKDLIIRGGENISPKEIEDILHAHPAVDVAAVVAMPHPRLGETGCAVVTVKPGKSFSFAEMERLLAQSGLARQKCPERLEIVPELPYTPAGKVRKNVLREFVRQITSDEADADGAAS
jgi:acyl-CoA synthetase (AMP-forming)/AMP-acid ligase II